MTTPKQYTQPLHTTKEVLETARTTMGEVLDLLDPDEYPFTTEMVAHALALLDTELERWVVPTTSPFGRLIVPRPPADA